MVKHTQTIRRLLPFCGVDAYWLELPHIRVLNVNHFSFWGLKRLVFKSINNYLGANSEAIDLAWLHISADTQVLIASPYNLTAWYISIA